MIRPHLLRVASGTLLALAILGSAGAAPPDAPTLPNPRGARIEILKQFDIDQDGVLSRAERDAAAAHLKKTQPMRFRKREASTLPPVRASAQNRERPDSRAPAPQEVPLYAREVLRTIHFEFAHADWERELDDFYHTDVEVPATMTVDGVAYREVGVRFRGYSTFFQVPPGKKRSLNVSVDFRDADQKLYGVKTLNLNNGFGDASLINAALYAELAAPHVPIPRVNMVRVVINGEYWGVYANVEQIDRLFVDRHFGPGAARWKAAGAPVADAALGYLGEDAKPYRSRYELRTRDTDDSWRALIDLTRTLNNTPVASREAALKPMLDIEGVLRVLALESVLMNADAIAFRASDYFLVRDRAGVFHVVPYDYNEAFRPLADPAVKAAQPSTRLDALVGATGDRVPMKMRLLEVPALRARYLALVREYADSLLDWKTLGPRVAAWRTLITDAVAADRRKSSATSLFTRMVAASPAGEAANVADAAIAPLRVFADRRRSYLLETVKAKDQ